MRISRGFTVFIPKGKERIKAAVFADMIYEEEML